MSDLTIRRLGYGLGAEIVGLNLKQRQSDQVIAAIRAAWLEHILLRFPEQDLSPEELVAFGSRFGQLDDNRSTPHLSHPEHASIFVLVNKPYKLNEKTFTGLIAEQWHTDLSHTFHPTTASFLNAKELPEIGGDTMFANMYRAYKSLSPTLQAIIEPLEAVHDISLAVGFDRGTPELQAERRRLNPPMAQSVVRVHPETGRKVLYIGDRIGHFVGMTAEESKPLIDFLYAHAVQYEFVYRHRWALNDLIMWDNRCAMHVAVRDYDHGRQVRRMQRCSLLGPKTGRLYLPAGDSALERPEKYTALKGAT
jgi:taurine dioxygenase